MRFFYYLLQMPPFALLMIMVIVFGGAGALGVYIFRKYIKISYKRSHNEVVGYAFAILGGFYGLILGFVMFFVWDSMKQAEDNASKESSLARALYRDIKYYPDTAKSNSLKKSYMVYVHSVVEREYPEMEQLHPLTDSDRIDFNDVFKKMETMNATDTRVVEMFSQLNDLATYRSLRHLDADSEIPIEIWVPLLLGALIIMVFAMMVDVESQRLHMLVNALLGIFIGMVMYIIIIVDHPFTGKMRIMPTGYETILDMEQHDK